MPTEKNITKLFVSEEISSLLRQKGFDEPCIAKYTQWSSGDKVDLYPQSQNFLKGPYFETCQNSMYTDGLDNGLAKVATPLYQQVIDWFAEKHNVNIYVIKHGRDDETEWQWWLNRCHSLASFKDKYEALNEAISEALKDI